MTLYWCSSQGCHFFGTPCIFNFISPNGSNQEIKDTTEEAINFLDCDQSNYSSRIIFSCTFTLELDRMNRFRDMVIQSYTRRTTAALLDLVQTEVETFDPPTRKTLQ